MVWDEHSLKISALQLLRFGCYDVLKILRKMIAQSVNQLMTKLFVELVFARICFTSEIPINHYNITD